MGDSPTPASKAARRRFHEPENQFAVYKELSLEESDWDKLSKAINNELSTATRDNITAIAGRFVQNSAEISLSPYADEVERELKRIKSVAEKLNRHLAEEQLSDAASSARSAIRWVLEDNYPDELDPLDEIHTWLNKIVSSCTEQIYLSRSRVELEDEYEYWTDMIFDLRELFKSQHFPFGISGGPRLSPFVAFYIALQRTFPDGTPRHDEQKPSALAKAMERACGYALDKRRAAAGRDCPN